MGYRYFALENALRLGVRGHVRNLPDGDVEVHAEGSEAVLDQLRSELERGPRLSRVEEVLEEPAALTGQYASFHVRG